MMLPDVQLKVPRNSDAYRKWHKAYVDATRGMPFARFIDYLRDNIVPSGAYFSEDMDNVILMFMTDDDMVQFKLTYM